MDTKERRKYMRITADLEADFWAKGPTMQSGHVRVRDFSRQGLGVLFPKRVERGEHVDLTMKVPGDNVPIFATAEVTWSGGGEGEGQMGAGLKFLSIKPLDLARLLDFVYSRWLGDLKQKI
ncbi:MAG: PilZ domain-containing protein [Candidatus Omnitrophica bacterium]|nr:PilZ domain-containing protein [Candidatus Omnitrophota bacterium]